MERDALGHTPAGASSSEERVRHLESELERQRLELAAYVAGLHRTIEKLAAELAAIRAPVAQPRGEAAPVAPAPQMAEEDRSLAEINQLRSSLSENEAGRLQLLRRIEALEASSSWRLTAPLRALSAFVRRRG